MCAIGLTYPFTHHINRLLMLLQEAGMNVDAIWWADEFTIYAHQARYEEGHLSADAPLDRDAILVAVVSLVERIDAEMESIQIKE